MRGRVASQGMAFAGAYPIDTPEIAVAQTKVEDPRAELARFQVACEQCADQILRLMDCAASGGDADAHDILDFQYLILEDTEFIGKIESMILDEGWNCLYAVSATAELYRSQLSAIENNSYLRERAADVADLTKRLLYVIVGARYEIDEPSTPYVAVAVDLTPSQVTGMDSKKLMGIVLEKGAMTAHTVIIAKSRGIPCLIETAGATAGAIQGQPVLLDGFLGEFYILPDAALIAKYEQYKAQQREEQEMLEVYRSRDTRTKDGFSMRVYANITSFQEVEALLKQGGEGVGLLRTELLYMEHTAEPPDEDQQFEAYRKAAQALNGRPLIIRTLDVGGDKDIPYLGIEREDNPFLGHRAIRYCLEQLALFRTQISAILRASAYGGVQIMFPMITTVDELRLARQAVEEVKEDLTARGIAHNDAIKVGMMIETPAAAFDAARFANLVDFFSIGTNDLTQYLFAADRTNAKVSGLNSYFQPTLLRAVNHVVTCARAAGIEVDICGQAGEVAELVPLWIGMGMENVSVSIPAITRVRRIICNAERQSSRQLLEEVLALDTEAEVRERLAQEI